MEKQQLQNLVEAYIKYAIENTTNGSCIWDNGDVEEFLHHSVTEEEMQQIEDLLLSDDRISEADVYTDDNNKVVIDCIFWLDACEQTCRHAVLFHNTKDGEKYYLQHKELLGDEQDESTDKQLIHQAEILEETGYEITNLKKKFEIEKVSNAFGIRNVIKTIELQ